MAKKRTGNLQQILNDAGVTQEQAISRATGATDYRDAMARVNAFENRSNQTATYSQLQDYTSALGSARNALRSMYISGFYDDDTVSSAVDAFSNAHKSMQDFMSQFETEDDYNHQRFRQKYSGASSKNISDNLRGLQQMAYEASKSGDKDRAKEINTELSWLKDHQYDYWTVPELDDYLKTLDTHVDKLKGVSTSSQQASAGYDRARGYTGGNELYEKFTGKKDSSKATLQNYQSERAKIESITKDRKFNKLLNEMDEEARYAFSKYEDWEATYNKAQRSGNAKYRIHDYERVIGDNGNDVRYKIKGTNQFVTDRDEIKYAEAVTGLERFNGLMREQGLSDEEIVSLKRYADQLRNAEKAQRQLEKIDEYVNSHNIGGNAALAALSVPASLVSGLPAFVEQAAQTVANGFRGVDPITGRQISVDPNRLFSRMAQGASAIRSEQAEDLGTVGGFLYSTGMSILDFVAAAGVGKAISGVAKIGNLALSESVAGNAAMSLLGGSAATQTMADVRARGGTDDQALTLGLLSGVFETLFEKVSLDSIVGLGKAAKEATHYTFRNFALDALKQAGVEASEEFNTTIANSIADMIVMADKNQINQSILQYMSEEGLGLDEATRKAWVDWGKQLGLDALAGFLSGGFVSGVKIGGLQFNNAVIGADIIRRGDTMDLVNTALELNADKGAYKLASELSERMESTDVNKQPTASEVGRLAYLATVESRENKMNPSVANEIPRTHETLRTTENGRTEAAVVLSATAEELMQNGLAAPYVASIAPTVESIIAGEQVSDSKLDAILASPAVAAVIKAHTGVEVDLDAPRSDRMSAYKEIIRQQAERIQELDQQREEIERQQADLTTDQVETTGEAQAASERMLLDAAAIQRANATGESAAPAQISEDDVVSLQNPDGSVNQMTRAEFKRSARMSYPDATVSDAELDRQFNAVLAAQQAKGGALNDREFSVFAAAAKAAPAQETASEAVPAQETAPETAPETPKEQPAPVEQPEKTQTVAEGVSFKPMEGGVQELNREQKWSAALAYRLLSKLGIKHIIWDEEHCGKFSRASIKSGEGTIYLNPKMLTARGVILRAVGHEIAHPATDDSGENVNPMAERIISAIQNVASKKMLRNAEQMNQFAPDSLLWQTENLGAVRKAMIDRYRSTYLDLAVQAEERGDTAKAAEYRDTAEKFDEHMANQEIAGDWIGMLFEYPELMEKLAGEKLKLPEKILRSLAKMRTGSAIKVLSGKDRKEAEKLLEGLMGEVNEAIRKNDNLKAFQPAATPKKRVTPRSRKAAAQAADRAKSRQDRVAEARRRIAERAEAERKAAGEEMPKSSSQERNMFVGEKSKLADLVSLEHAKRLETQGYEPDKIRNITMWFRGADGKWRYEIADDKMTLRTNGSARMYNDYPEYREFSDLEYRIILGETLTDEEQARFDELAKTMIPLRKETNKATRKRIREGTATLDDVLVHPELFASYPELKNMTVEIKNFGRPSLYGYFDPDTFSLHINSEASDSRNSEMRKTVAHEIQHAIQTLDGLSKGSNPYYWMVQKGKAYEAVMNARDKLNTKNFKRLFKWMAAFDEGKEAQMRKIEEEVAAEGNAQQTEMFRRGIGGYQLTQDPRIDYQLYEDTAGEREARDTENRLERSLNWRLEERNRPDLGENPVFSEDPLKLNHEIKSPNGKPKSSSASAPSERNSFVGEHSRLADKDALAVAKELAAKGVEDHNIRLATNWFRGMDGKWRYEIGDDKAKLTLDKAEAQIKARTIATLPDVLDHPELFEAYPELKNIWFDMRDTGDPEYSAYYDSGNNQITLNTGVADFDTRDHLADLMHEVQHAVQRIEGFARGATEERWRYLQQEARNAEIMALQNLSNKDMDLYDDWKYAFESGDYAEMIRIEKRVARWKNEDRREAFQNAMGARQLIYDGRSPSALYNDTAGEFEARDVERRLPYTPEERAERMPFRLAEPRFVEDPFQYTPTEKLLEENPEFEDWDVGEPPEIQERFSLNSPVEYTPNLIAIHNVSSPASLMRYLQEGGMPTASIAIIKKGMKHGRFGPYSVIIDRNFMDPEQNPELKAWAGDSWTPQRDELAYRRKLPEDVMDEFDALLRSARLSENRINTIEGLVRGSSTAQRIIDYFGATSNTGKAIAKAIRPDLASEIESVANVGVKRQYALELKEQLDSYDPGDWDLILWSLEDLDSETGENYHKKFKKAPKDLTPLYEYANRYLQGPASNVVEETLENYFTNLLSKATKTVEAENDRGEVKELPYSLENVAQLMNFMVNGRYRGHEIEVTDYTQGAEGFQAHAVPEFKSVADMHRLENRLERNQPKHRQAVENFERAVDKFLYSTGVETHYLWSPGMLTGEGVRLLERLAEGIREGYTHRDEPDFANYVQELFGFGLPDEAINRAIDAMDAFAAIPQQYFEAKATGAVPLSAIRAVVIPVNTAAVDPAESRRPLNEQAHQELISALNDAGIKTIFYDDSGVTRAQNNAAGNLPTREEAINDPSLDLERFSLNEPLEVQVLRAMHNRVAQSDAVNFGDMPEVLKAIGMDDLKLLMWSTHLNQMGLPKDPNNIHAHGITAEQALRLPEELAKPVLIFDPSSEKRTADNTVGVVTNMVDGDGLPIIAYVTDRGDFSLIDLNAAGTTPEEVENVGAIRTAYGYGKSPAEVKQPTPEDVGFVDDKTFTKLMQDALAEDNILFVNHERLHELEKSMRAAVGKTNAAGEVVGYRPENFTATRPSVQRRSGTEVPGGIYTLPNGTIIHKSRNLVKLSEQTRGEIQRYSGPTGLAPNNPSERFYVDPEAYKRFFSDLYESRGLTPQRAAESEQRSPTQEVSAFRTDTLQHSDALFTQAELNMEGLRKEDSTYDVLTNIESMRQAKERLEKDYAGTMQDLNDRAWRSAVDLDAGMGILAVKIAEARVSGDYTAAIDWAHLIRENGTAAGQFVQAFAKYSKTPEGVLLNAVDALAQTNLSQEEQDDLLERIAEFSNTLSGIRRGEEGDRDALLDLIVLQADQRNTPIGRQTMKDLAMQKVEYLYDAALNQMDQIAKDYIKPSIGQQIATFQTISHLFNFKTANRNLVSNTVFSPLAAVATNLAMVPDVVTSLFTGRRTVGADKWLFSKQMWKGVSEGARTAHVELALDIDPRPNNRDKYGTARRTWKMVNGRAARVGSTIEKAMGFELNWTDEFHKGGIRGEIMNGLEPLIKSGQITREMAAEWAEQEALYRAFQDDTFANGLLAIIKNGLNTIGTGRTGQYIGRLEVKEFGLGDIVQKYTQVPGALITRAVEFSPVGYIKTIALLSQMRSANKALAKAEADAENAQARAKRNSGSKALAQQAFRAKDAVARKEADAATAQRRFALAMGRATTGTGLIAAFATAAAAGLLRRADDEDDPNAKALMTSMGVTGTQFNVSAAMRAINGQGTKWQQGDHLVQVDFLEPMNASMTIGALIAKEAKEDATFWGKLGNAGTQNIIGLWDAMQEIPTMQTLNTIQQTRQYYDPETAIVGIEPIDMAIEVARSGVTGFVPSPIRQTAQALDTVQRDTYTSKNAFEQTKDALRNSFPVAREKLPAKLDNFGEPRKLENPALNALNAAFLPGSVRTYRLSQEAEELDKVYKATGEKNIFPNRNAPYSQTVTIDGENVKLTLNKEERQKFQETRGQTSFKVYQDMMNDPVYQSSSAPEKAAMLAEAKNYANYVAVKELAVSQGHKYTSAKYEKYAEAMDNGYTMASWLTTTGTANSVTGVDENGDGKADSGTVKKEALQLIQELNLTEEQKAFWFRQSDYNGDDDKLGAAMEKNISPTVYIDSAIRIADAKGVDENGDGKADSGTVRNAKAEIINNLPLTPEQKKWLFLQYASTSTKFADSYNWTNTAN